MHLSGPARKVPSALAGPSAEASQRAFGLPPRCGLIEHDERRRADHQRRRPALPRQPKVLTGSSPARERMCNYPPNPAEGP
jgi:hypothetical protein